MLTYTTSLPVGPYDWFAERIPRDEFERRLALTRSLLQAKNLAALIVHGRSFDFAAMSWLTGFVPKLGPAYVFIAREGAPRIVFSGGNSMVPSGKRLTWVDDVRGLTDPGANLSEWLAECGLSGHAIGIGGSGALTRDHFDRLSAAAGAGTLRDVTDDLDALRRTKTAVERAHIARAAEILDQCFVTAVAKAKANASAQSVAVAVERQAFELGAQDVRVRLSTADQAEPAIIADVPVDLGRPTFNMYAAVRVNGYWAKAIATLGAATPLAEQARDALDEHVRALVKASAMPPATTSDADITVERSGIGAALSELPADGGKLQAGDVCTIIAAARSGATIGYASALIEVGDNTVTVLRTF